MDKQIKKVAEMIYSIALYEGYQTTLKQTIINLQTSSQDRVFQNPRDQYIFDDLNEAINFGSQFSKVTVEIFKGINFKMNSLGEGQPEHPGMLRKNVLISVGDYVPLDTITEEMVQWQLDAVQGSSIQSSWELYARLAKLQAFDNGNKRTSLICANINSGALKDDTDNFLMIPTDYKRVQFDTNLYYYYMADDRDKQLPDEHHSLNKFINFASDITIKK